MVPNLGNLQVLECESCQQRKHVRSPFPKGSETKYNVISSIIHFDIWGPRRLTSFRFSYFVIFIDKHSQWTWVYLRKDWSKLFFCSFFNEIKNQFGKVIKVLRNDNAKEYFSSNFHTFFKFTSYFTQVHQPSHTLEKWYNRSKTHDIMHSVSQWASRPDIMHSVYVQGFT